MLSTPIKRASLLQAKRASVDASPVTSLLTKLEDNWLAAQARIASGQLIASTAANGHSTSFSAPGADGVSPAEYVELWDELVTLFGQVKADIGGSPSDTVVYTEMMARLVPSYESEGDYSALRCVG